MPTLKELRTQVGISQDVLARRAKVARWKIAFAETERTVLTADEQARILKVLAVAACATAQKIAGVLGS